MKVPELSDRFFTSFKYSLRSVHTDVFSPTFVAKRVQLSWNYLGTPTIKTTSWKNCVTLDLVLGMYLHTEQLWQGEKNIQHNSKATAVAQRDNHLLPLFFRILPAWRIFSWPHEYTEKQVLAHSSGFHVFSFALGLLNVYLSCSFPSL